ncbi:MAG: DUF502 domain-containing protein [Gammaproteobacteria bacterium]|nr:DUF502 domain-containing protein [Gammaproteobacteria bacterium]
MSRFLNFIKTTAIGGLLVIVPLAIILFVLGQVLYALYGLSEKIISELGIEVSYALTVLGIAVLALVGLCFFTGLLVRTRFGLAFKHWFNRTVGKRIPMYRALSNLTKRFAGVDGNDFAPVEIDLYGSDARAIGFLIESLPDKRCAVFVPSAPVATVGNVYVVAEDKVTRLNASVTDTLTALTQWGVDTRPLYGLKPGSDDDSDE